HERGMLEYPWPQSNLRGEVRFSDHQIAIDLQVPWYEDGNTIKQFDPYDGNTDMAFQMESAAVSPESR
ncbi:MAG TPA: hypothetical protein VHX44_16000, partial [Planctomycetota bacterium]|nr:hypothetical protein [Planctomycetota bacterium]